MFHKTHPFDTEILHDSKNVVCFLLRCVELPKPASQKMMSHFFAMQCYKDAKKEMFFKLYMCMVYIWFPNIYFVFLVSENVVFYYIFSKKRLLEILNIKNTKFVQSEMAVLMNSLLQVFYLPICSKILFDRNRREVV